MINICMLRPVNIEEMIPREKKEYKISFFSVRLRRFFPKKLIIQIRITFIYT